MACLIIDVGENNDVGLEEVLKHDDLPPFTCTSKAEASSLR